MSATHWHDADERGRYYPQGTKRPCNEDHEPILCGALGEDGRGFTAACTFPKYHASPCSWWNLPVSASLSSGDTTP